MDLKGSEFNIRLFTHELERYQRQTKDNNQPSDIASSVHAIKENLSSLKVETRKVVSGYIKANLVDKANGLMDSFRSKYAEAKTFVRNANAKLSNLGVDRLSSIDSLSEVEQELPHVNSPLHHNVYHSKPVVDEKVEPPEPLSLPSRPSRASQRAPVPTRQVLEGREQIAKGDLLTVLRTPQGLSHETTLTIQKYINLVKDRFLAYKDVYLELKDFLLSHGCTEEQVRLKLNYTNLQRESNHLIHKINEILEDRNEELGSVLGSVTPPEDPNEQDSRAPSVNNDFVDLLGATNELAPTHVGTNLGPSQRRENVAVVGEGRMKSPSGGVSFGPATVGPPRHHYEAHRSRSSSSESSDRFNRKPNLSAKYDAKIATSYGEPTPWCFWQPSG